MVLKEPRLLLPACPQREALSRNGRTLLGKPSTTPKSFSLGTLPPPGQIHAAQDCPTHAEAQTFSASPSCRSAIPMLRSSMGLGFPHPGEPCPAGAPLGRAGLGLQNWTVVLLFLPFQPRRCFHEHCVQHKVPPKKSAAKTPCFGWKHSRDQADLGTLSSQGGQRGFGLVTYPLGPSFCSEQLKARQADCYNARLFFTGASSRPGQRQSRWGHCSWEKAQVLIDFIH